jgi:hypothetical protein
MNRNRIGGPLRITGLACVHKWKKMSVGELKYDPIRRKEDNMNHQSLIAVLLGLVLLAGLVTGAHAQTHGAAAPSTTGTQAGGSAANRSLGHVPGYIYVIFGILAGIAVLAGIGSLSGGETAGCNAASGFLGLLWVVFYFTAGGFLYGTRDSLILTFVYSGALGLLALLGVIPIIGPILYHWLAFSHVAPGILGAFPELAPSWMTVVPLWLGLVGSIGYTLIVLGVAAKSVSST